MPPNRTLPPRYLLRILAASCLTAGPVAGADTKVPSSQDLEDLPSLETMKTPDSPAFSLLGLSPNEVERPTTPSALAASLNNGVTRDGDTFSFKALALEVAPFWLWSHPELLLQDDLDGNFGQRLIENFTLTLATQLEDGVAEEGMSSSAEATPATRAALGARTILLKGDPSERARGCKEILANANKIVANEVVRQTDEFRRTYKEMHPPPEPPPDRPSRAAYTTDEAFLTAFNKWKAKAKADRAEWDSKAEDALRLSELVAIPIAEGKFMEAFEKCLTGVHERQGFLLSAAGAAGWDFAQNDLAHGELAQWAAWLTPAYDFGAVTLAGALRYGARSEANTFDLGGRVIYSWSTLGVSLEGVARFTDDDVDPGTRSRFALGFDYNLLDGVWLNTSLVKDFGGGDTGPILGIANIQFNLGAKRSVHPDTNWVSSVEATPAAATSEKPAVTTATVTPTTGNTAAPAATEVSVAPAPTMPAQPGESSGISPGPVDGHPETLPSTQPPLPFVPKDP